MDTWVMMMQDTKVSLQCLPYSHQVFIGRYTHTHTHTHTQQMSFLAAWHDDDLLFIKWK